MKPVFLVVATLAALLTWWLTRPSHHGGPIILRALARRLGRSIAAGMAVYVLLMLIAMVWLLITT